MKIKTGREYTVRKEENKIATHQPTTSLSLLFIPRNLLARDQLDLDAPSLLSQLGGHAIGWRAQLLAKADHQIVLESEGEETIWNNTEDNATLHKNQSIDQSI
jgi:hypothetical protein